MTERHGFSTMPAMTIREHFRLVQKRCTYALVAVAVVVVFYMEARYPKLPRDAYFLVGLGLIAVMAPPFFILGKRLYRCPRCDAFLNMKGQTANRPYRPGSFWDRWDACPNCQLSFDASWSKPYKAGELES